MFVLAIWVVLLTNNHLDTCRASTLFSETFFEPFCPAYTSPSTTVTVYDIVYLIVNLFPVLLVFALYFGMTPILSRWKADPARLVAIASRGVLRARDFGNQLGFRFIFGHAFKELTDALKPKRLVIFIDDLDRCRPEQVVETLEAVNFLVNAAPCYVVMGDCTDASDVRHWVGLQGDGGRNSWHTGRQPAWGSRGFDA